MQSHKEYEIMILKVIAASFTIQLKKKVIYMSNIWLIVLAIVQTPNSIVKLNPSTSFE